MPTIQIRPGEAQFWEMGHIEADRFLKVQVKRMPFSVIGRDGYFLPHPIKMDEVLLGAQLSRLPARLHCAPPPCQAV
jgi:hypothetical protein